MHLKWSVYDNTMLMLVVHIMKISQLLKLCGPSKLSMWTPLDFETLTIWASSSGLVWPLDSKLLGLVTGPNVAINDLGLNTGLSVSTNSWGLVTGLNVAVNNLGLDTGLSVLSWYVGLDIGLRVFPFNPWILNFGTLWIWNLADSEHFESLNSEYWTSDYYGLYGFWILWTSKFKHSKIIEHWISWD